MGGLGRPGESSDVVVMSASQSGYIEFVRAIVAESITKMQALGEQVHGAPTFLAKGDGLLAQQKYKRAYDFFVSAYRRAAKP